MTYKPEYWVLANGADTTVVRAVEQDDQLIEILWFGANKSDNWSDVKATGWKIVRVLDIDKK